jgi:hypothetical protein
LWAKQWQVFSRGKRNAALHAGANHAVSRDRRDRQRPPNSNKERTMSKQTAAQSAIRKLEEFYLSLNPDERKVIALIVSSSLQRAARAQAERDWLTDGEALLELIGPQYAPKLVAELGTYVAGQLAPQQLGSMPSEKRSRK